MVTPPRLFFATLAASVCLIVAYETGLLGALLPPITVALIPLVGTVALIGTGLAAAKHAAGGVFNAFDTRMFATATAVGLIGLTAGWFAPAAPLFTEWGMALTLVGCVGLVGVEVSTGRLSVRGLICAAAAAGVCAHTVESFVSGFALTDTTTTQLLAQTAAAALIVPAAVAIFVTVAGPRANTVAAARAGQRRVMPPTLGDRAAG